MADTAAPAHSAAPTRSALPLRRDMLGALLEAHRAAGDLVRFVPVPRAPLFAAFHPSDVHRVLQSNADAYRKDNVFYGELGWAFGDGLLTSQDDAWLRQRRFVQPLFTRKRVDGYAATMVDETRKRLAGWRTAGTVDLDAEMTALTLQIVGTILFGADTDRVLPVVQRGFPVVGEQVLRRSIALVPLRPDWPTPRQSRTLRARRSMREACEALISDRRADPGEGDDLLGRLIAAPDHGDGAITDDEVRDQVLVFLLAGHDTTAITLTMALHLLAEHPEAQARVRDEASAISGADLSGLTYTVAVLKETLRLYPPGWGISRRAVEDDVLAGYRIPAQADVLVSTWVTHRHPEFWEQPERFDPDRFAPGVEHHKFAWFPFGAGPRACIGQHFSMLEAAIALATAVGEFELTAVDRSPIKMVPRITLRPAQPIRCRVTPVTA